MCSIELFVYFVFNRSKNDLHHQKAKKKTTSKTFEHFFFLKLFSSDKLSNEVKTRFFKLVPSTLRDI